MVEEDKAPGGMAMSTILEKLKKYTLILAGTLALVLGVIGLVVRLLPTTPFLLISSWCYIRSSERLHQRLLESQLYKRYLKRVVEGEGIPIKTKILILLWVWALLLMIFFTTTSPLLKVIALLLGSSKTLFFLFLVKSV